MDEDFHVIWAKQEASHFWKLKKNRISTNHKTAVTVAPFKLYLSPNDLIGFVFYPSL